VLLEWTSWRYGCGVARDVPDIAIVLDRTAGPGLPAQIATALRRAVAAGVLAPGEPAPSTRSLAARLSVSRGTVEAAYEQLSAEGYLIGRPRSGHYVDPDLVVVAPVARPGERPAPLERRVGTSRWSPERAVVDLVPGHEAASPLHDAAWRSAWRRAGAPSGARIRPDPAGVPQLREAIAEHLRLMRGIAVAADRIVVTAGAREGLGLLLAALLPPDERVPEILVEDPGFPGLRTFLRRRPVQVRPVAPDRMPTSDTGPVAAADLAILTPNHQFPDGHAMGAHLRGRLLEWAARTGTLLVEDDYDSESRYLGPPLPTLFGLAGDAPVIQLGTFSGVLTHDIGTGYLLVPEPLLAPVLATRADLGCPVAPVTQRAVAYYVAEGGLRRRLGRARRSLVAARRVVADRLADLPGAVDGGRLLVIDLPGEAAETVRRRCADRGVLVGDLAVGWAATTPRTGVLVDYGGVEAAVLGPALEVLVEAVAGVRAEAPGPLGGAPDRTPELPSALGERAPSA